MNTVLITGSFLTAVTYFLFAFMPVKSENLITTGILNSPGFINFIYKLTYLALSVAALSLLGLAVKEIPNIILINVSCGALILVLIISLLTKLNDRFEIYNSIYYLRVVPAVLLLIYLANIQYRV